MGVENQMHCANNNEAENEQNEQMVFVKIKFGGVRIGKANCEYLRTLVEFPYLYSPEVGKLPKEICIEEYLYDKFLKQAADEPTLGFFTTLVQHVLCNCRHST